ncbi:MAG: Jag N-terminal domain-containing protein [Anaerolinea sp.]|nr:Jag N-terminal domain-containing protein [Anaerolinea sp.]
MNDQIVEVTGDTVEAAIQIGLKQLGVSPAEVLVDVLDEGSLGVFGLGARPARVRLERITRTPLPGADQTTQISKPYLESTPITLPTPSATPSVPMAVPGAKSREADAQRRESRKPRRERDHAQRVARPQSPHPETRSRSERTPRPERRERPKRGARYNEVALSPEPVVRAQILDDNLPEYLDVSIDEDENAAVPLLSESIEVSEAELGEEAQIGRVVLNELLERMDIRAQIHVRRAQPDEKSAQSPWILDIAGDHPVLIGRRGDTLAALQYITRLITSREMQKRSEVIVDVNGYKVKRARTLQNLALRMADEAVQRQRTVALEPMPPHERRIIHLALRGRSDVVTKSIGEGAARKVTIVPRTDSSQE